MEVRGCDLLNQHFPSSHISFTKRGVKFLNKVFTIACCFIKISPIIFRMKIVDFEIATFNKVLHKMVTNINVSAQWVALIIELVEDRGKWINGMIVSLPRKGFNANGNGYDDGCG